MKYFLLILLSLPLYLVGQNEIKVSAEVEALAAKMGNKGIVYGKFVGFAGSTPDEFKAFESFVKLASEAEIKHYLKHDDPSLRAYAFWALRLRNIAEAKKVLPLMKADQETIGTMMGGCIISESTVFHFSQDIMNSPLNKLFASERKSQGNHLIENY